MIRLHALRQAADPGTVEQAWQALDEAHMPFTPGAHLGVEAGVPHLHPLQATLLAQADWSLQLYPNGIALKLHSEWGHRLFSLPDLSDWTRRAGRAQAWPVRDALRAFSALFESASHPLLIGALRFDAYRLRPDEAALVAANPSRPADASLGLLMGGKRWLQRDAQGAWWTWDLSIADLAQGVATASPLPLVPPRTALPNADADGLAHKGHGTAAPQDDAVAGAHAARVRRSLPRLASGELVSLTLSQSYRRTVELSARTAYDRLRTVNPAPGCFYLFDGAGERVFGASPDLQLCVQGSRVATYPVCGTVARQPGAVGAAQSLHELINESVDAAALAVCTDAMRSDLAPWCVAGSLRLVARREPMFLSTVVHTVDAIEGELQPGSHAWDLILATTAPAMVTGTPRAAAVRAIADLEADARGWYGGVVVQMQANGDALALTLLRAATVRDGVAEVRTGGDLLADSDPQREEEESRLKTRSLWRAFGLESAALPGSASQGVPLSASAGPRRLDVALADPDAAFVQGLADALRGIGVAVRFVSAAQAASGADRALVRVVTEWSRSSIVPPGVPACATLALGDAALARLAADGAPVDVHAAGRGRLLRFHMTDEGAKHLRSCMSRPEPFWVGAHASRRLMGPVPAGWQLWGEDTEGAPLMLAREGNGRESPCVLMLFRPDSLLSDAAACAVLRAVLYWLDMGEPTRTSVGAV